MNQNQQLTFSYILQFTLSLVNLSQSLKTEPNAQGVVMINWEGELLITTKLAIPAQTKFHHLNRVTKYI